MLSCVTDTDDDRLAANAALLYKVHFGTSNNIVLLHDKKNIASYGVQ